MCKNFFCFSWLAWNIRFKRSYNCVNVPPKVLNDISWIWPWRQFWESERRCWSRPAAWNSPHPLLPLREEEKETSHVSNEHACITNLNSLPWNVSIKSPRFHSCSRSLTKESISLKHKQCKNCHSFIKNEAYYHMHDSIHLTTPWVNIPHFWQNTTVLLQ